MADSASIVPQHYVRFGFVLAASIHAALTAALFITVRTSSENRLPSHLVTLGEDPNPVEHAPETEPRSVPPSPSVTERRAPRTPAKAVHAHAPERAGIALPVSQAREATLVHAPLDGSTLGIAPEYPRRARERRVEGTVVYQLRFNSSGELEDILLENTSGSPLLDDAALRALRRARFPDRWQNAVRSIAFNFKLRPER